MLSLSPPGGAADDLEGTNGVAVGDSTVSTDLAGSEGRSMPAEEEESTGKPEGISATGDSLDSSCPVSPFNRTASAFRPFRWRRFAFNFESVAGDSESVAGDSERVAGDLERVAGASSAYFVVPGRLAFNFVVSGDLERVAGDLRRMAGAGRDLLPCGVIEKFTTSPFKLKVVIQ